MKEIRVSDLPEFLTSADLIRLGLYTSTDACYFARKTGNSPDFIQIKRKVLYPRDGVIKFLDERKKSGDTARVLWNSSVGKYMKIELDQI